MSHSLLAVGAVGVRVPLYLGHSRYGIEIVGFINFYFFSWREGGGGKYFFIFNGVGPENETVKFFFFCIFL